MSEKTSSTDLSKLSEKYPEFSVHQHEKFMVVRVFASLNEESASALGRAIEEIQKIKLQPVVVDCQGQNDLNHFWARVLVSLSRALARSQQKLVGVNCNERMKRHLMTEGLNSALPTADTLDAAMEKLGFTKPGKALDVTLINPFIGAATNAIAAQMSTPSTTGAATPLKPNAALAGDVSGLITLDCGSMRAVVIITFPKETIFKLVGKVIGSPPSEVNSMVKGSVGEITNVAFTRGKKTLNEMGFGIKSAVPMVVDCRELPPEYWQYTGPGVVIPFTTDCGSYYAEIRLAA